MRGDVIDNLLRKCPIYRGTFASDEVYKFALSRWPALAVFNNKPRAHEGEHWTVVYIDERGRGGEYFDSYGLRPPTSIERFLNERCQDWDFNGERIQSLVSNYCGLYCVMYCWYKCRGKTINEMLNVFTTDTMLNDYIVQRFIKSLS